MTKERTVYSSCPGIPRCPDRQHLLSAGRLWVVAFFIFLASCQLAKAQSLLEFSYASYGLENDTINVLQNVAHLDEFYRKLHSLKTNGKGKVSIVHIGDSHIQGDYLTQPLRRNLQQEFGNAGRGLVVPGRVAGTNESYNIVSSSNVEWSSKRCLFPDQPLPIGIGGITISSGQPGAGFSLAMNDLWLDYAFNSLTLFFENDGTSYDFLVRDGTLRELGTVTTGQDDRNYATLLLGERVSAVNVMTTRSDPAQQKATIFGLSLENGDDGILYHSIGVNGARFRHYNAAVFFAEQTAALLPGLFVISLGTNEALAHPFRDETFLNDIDALADSLHAHNRDAAFIFVTPPSSYDGTGKPNPRVGIVRKLIIRYAVENGFAFWDKYMVMGGDDGAGPWRRLELLRPDGVHFTREAYEYQANLFYAAILKGYNEYVLQH